MFVVQLRDQGGWECGRFELVDAPSKVLQWGDRHYIYSHKRGEFEPIFYYYETEVQVLAASP